MLPPHPTPSAHPARRHPAALPALIVAGSFAFALLPARLGANPAGESLRSGAAEFLREGNSLTIKQGSEKLIVDWQSFGIAPGETTRFLQPGRNAAALNRVLGGNPSAIHGLLEAKGRILLINPNGILVGPTGRINAAGFLASTLDTTDAEFLSGGPMRFTGASQATVRNEGTIRAMDGDIFLIGRQVENAGLLEAPAGTVGLAGGTDWTLQPEGEERFGVSLGGTNGSVTNTGTITAARAELKAAGGNLYALAIQNSGTIRATGVQRKNGRVLLTANRGTIEQSGTIAARNADGAGGDIRIGNGNPGTRIVNTGTLDASGVRGGSIILSAEEIELGGTSRISADGELGGGSIRIGGGWHGEDPEVANAERLHVAPGARITADATRKGNGGEVVLWSNRSTEFYGAISARGGPGGGNGGSAEVSGRDRLVYQGTADLRAPSGVAGTLLLDPSRIFLALNQTSATAAGMVGTDTDASIAPPLPFRDYGTSADSLLLLGALTAQLALSDVLVTTANSDGTGNGDLIVVDPFGWAGANTLTLRADNDLRVLGAISAPSGTLVLDVAGAATQTAGIQTAGLLLTGGGCFTLTDASNEVGTLSASTAGDIRFRQAGASPLGIGSLEGIDGVTSTGGLVDIRTGGALTVDQAVSADTGVTLVAEGTLALNNDVNAGTDAALSTGTALVRAPGAAITAAAGRSLLYSVDPALDTLNGLTSDFVQFDATFASNPPASVAAAGDGFLYATSAPPPPNPPKPPGPTPPPPAGSSNPPPPGPTPGPGPTPNPQTVTQVGKILSLPITTIPFTNTFEPPGTITPGGVSPFGPGGLGTGLFLDPDQAVTLLGGGIGTTTPLGEAPRSLTQALGDGILFMLSEAIGLGAGPTDSAMVGPGQAFLLGGQPPGTGVLLGDTPGALREGLSAAVLAALEAAIAADDATRSNRNPRVYLLDAGDLLEAPAAGAARLGTVNEAPAAIRSALAPPIETTLSAEASR